MSAPGYIRILSDYFSALAGENSRKSEYLRSDYIVTPMRLQHLWNGLSALDEYILIGHNYGQQKQTHQSMSTYGLNVLVG